MVDPTKECLPLWTHWSHQSGLQSQDSHERRTPEICTPKERVLEVAKKKIQQNHKMYHWRPSILGSFEVLIDHGDAAEDDVDVDKSSEDATEIMPPPTPASWFKKTDTSKHTEMHCRSFRKPCNVNLAMETAETKSLHSSIVGLGSMSSLMCCSKWILGHEMHRSLCPV